MKPNKSKDLRKDVELMMIDNNNYKNTKIYTYEKDS